MKKRKSLKRPRKNSIFRILSKSKCTRRSKTTITISNWTTRGISFSGATGSRPPCFQGTGNRDLDFGKILLERLKTDLTDLATIELSCKMEGRNMISMFVADKMKIKEFTRKIEQEKKRQESLAKLEVKSEVKPEQA